MIKFIDDQYTKQVVGWQKNVRNLDNFIELSQSLYLLPLFGNNILSQLEYAIVNGTLVPNSDLEILYLNYIKPCLAYYTAYLALNTIHYQVTETGVITRAGGDNTSIDKKTISELQNDYMNMANEFIKKGLTFVEKNITSFPTYVLEFKTLDTDNRKPKQLGNILFKHRKGICEKKTSFLNNI